MIYRYGDFPLQTAQALCNELKKTFPEVAVSDEVLTLSAEHYLKERNRYKGGGLPKDLKKHQHGDASLELKYAFALQFDDYIGMCTPDKYHLRFLP